MYFVIFDKNTYEKIGGVITNHSISLDDAIGYLNPTYLDIVNPDDPDYIIDGQEVWYDDLTMLLEYDYIAEKIHNVKNLEDIKDDITELADRAGLAAEWEMADGDTLESVIRMIQDKLDIDLGL